jgi:excinuclease ABC subunit C
VDIKEKIKNLPTSSGVYLMKDDKGVVLYVGKADNLKKRVSSYFYPRRHHSERIELLVSKVRDVEYIPTATSAEALIYENSLIKQLAPRYNVALRDDKSYPMLKLTVNEKFPRLFITRQKKDDGALYYGPYTSAVLLKRAVEILRQLFPLRVCNVLPKRVCLYYHIKQCPGPCEGKIGEASYIEMVRELKLFLDGRRAELVKVLSERMKKAAGSQDFEEATALRDRIEALSAMKDRKVVYGPMHESEELKRIAGIAGELHTIEAFDVSNIMGEEAVGSMVYFYKGRPKKSEYRKFRIKTVSAIDDYAMMREIVRRRYARLSEEKKPLPDLIIIDGGKGHLGVAIDELKRLGLSGIPVIGIAKEFERIYRPDRKDPVILPKDSKALRLVERIRDEAHRFAIAYHKALLSKRIGSSELDGIPGVGPKRKKALLNRFGSVENLKKASLEEVAAVGGMDEKSARNIIGYFKGRSA